MLEGYCKTLQIEALTMVDMVKKEIIPACIAYQNELAELLGRKKACGSYDFSLEDYLLEHISKLSTCLLKKLTVLEHELLESKEKQELLSLAVFYRNRVFAAMLELRQIVDELEIIVSKKHWPLPTYADMFFRYCETPPDICQSRY